jgi:3-phenylpropionate/trans-cinnamate dioxygenase ferredoxin component
MELGERLGNDKQVELTKFPIAKPEEIPRGEMVCAEVAGQRILVANVDGEYFAMNARCNHMGGPLDKGRLEGSLVTRPLHGSKWDVKTGHLAQFTRPLPPERTYRATVEGGQVWVEV